MRNIKKLQQQISNLAQNFFKYSQMSCDVKSIKHRIGTLEAELRQHREYNVTLVAYPPDITIVADSKKLDGATVSAIITKLITETGMSAQDATDMLERIKCEIQNKAFSNPVKG